MAVRIGELPEVGINENAKIVMPHFIKHRCKKVRAILTIRKRRTFYPAYWRGVI